MSLASSFPHHEYSQRSFSSVLESVCFVDIETLPFDVHDLCLLTVSAEKLMPEYRERRQGYSSLMVQLELLFLIRSVHV